MEQVYKVMKRIMPLAQTMIIMRSITGGVGYLKEYGQDTGINQIIGGLFGFYEQC
jgi:hypothetical protein